MNTREFRNHLGALQSTLGENQRVQKLKEIFEVGFKVDIRANNGFSATLFQVPQSLDQPQSRTQQPVKGLFGDLGFIELGFKLRDLIEKTIKERTDMIEQETKDTLRTQAEALYKATLPDDKG